MRLPIQYREVMDYHPVQASLSLMTRGLPSPMLTKFPNHGNSLALKSCTRVVEVVLFL